MLTNVFPVEWSALSNEQQQAYQAGFRVHAGVLAALASKGRLTARDFEDVAGNYTEFICWLHSYQIGSAYAHSNAAGLSVAARGHCACADSL